MPNIELARVVESGVFVWTWTSLHGLLVVRGAAGGGGGGGGAFCLEGLNLYGAGRWRRWRRWQGNQRKARTNDL